MKQRLVTLGLAACALALFWLLMFPKPFRQTPAPRPLTTGTDAEGYYAAVRWLSAAGVPSVTLHRRFDQLQSPAISARATGNLLITTLPYDTAMKVEEFDSLDHWISHGNTVLILAALDDTPLWCGLSSNFNLDLQRIAGIQFSPVIAPGAGTVREAKQTLALALTQQGSAITLHPSGRFGLLDGVRQLATVSALPSQQWKAEAMDSQPVLALARRADTAEPVIWAKGSGQGAILLSGYASPFNNATIGKLDNARLLSNIIAWSLRPGGRVIFDDAHQGVIEEYDPAKFFADPRLHWTLLWLVLLWLAWVLATQPLRAATPNASPFDERAMLSVTARFLAGALRPVASAQWLLDEFFGRMRRRHGMPPGGPPWEWLAAKAGVSETVLDELREVYARTQAGRRVSLVRLQRILSEISGQIS